MICTQAYLVGLWLHVGMSTVHTWYIYCTVGFWCQGIAQKIFRTFDTSFDTKMMVKSGAIEITFKSYKPLSYLLTAQANSAKQAG